MISQTLSELGKRREIRISTQIEAQLKTDDKNGTGLITNLSLSGLQMECDRKMLFDLMPNIQRPDPRQPLRVTVSFRLPAGDQAMIELVCQMMYARRVARERFLIGGQIHTISDQDQARLDAFLK